MPRFPRPFGGSKNNKPQSDNQVAANNDQATSLGGPAFEADPPANNIDLAVLMLRQAGHIFRALGEENPDLQNRMELLAGAYEAIASLTELDPEGEAPAGAETLVNL